MGLRFSCSDSCYDTPLLLILLSFNHDTDLVIYGDGERKNEDFLFGTCPRLHGLLLATL